MLIIMTEKNNRILAVSNMNKFDESVILLKLSAAAKEHDVILTYAHKLFFMKLLNYIDGFCGGSDCNYSIALSSDELCRVLNTPIRTLCQSFDRLAKIGAITRKPSEEKSFPIKPFMTIINQDFIVRE